MQGSAAVGPSHRSSAAIVAQQQQQPLANTTMTSPSPQAPSRPYYNNNNTNTGQNRGVTRAEAVDFLRSIPMAAKVPTTTTAPNSANRQQASSASVPVSGGQDSQQQQQQPQQQQSQRHHPNQMPAQNKQPLQQQHQQQRHFQHHLHHLHPGSRPFVAPAGPHPGGGAASAAAFKQPAQPQMAQQQQQAQPCVVAAVDSGATTTTGSSSSASSSSSSATAGEDGSDGQSGSSGISRSTSSKQQQQQHTSRAASAPRQQQQHSTQAHLHYHTPQRSAHHAALHHPYQPSSTVHQAMATAVGGVRSGVALQRPTSNALASSQLPLKRPATAVSSGQQQQQQQAAIKRTAALPDQQQGKSLSVVTTTTTRSSTDERNRKAKMFLGHIPMTKNEKLGHPNQMAASEASNSVHSISSTTSTVGTSEVHQVTAASSSANADASRSSNRPLPLAVPVSERHPNLYRITNMKELQRKVLDQQPSSQNGINSNQNSFGIARAIFGQEEGSEQLSSKRLLHHDEVTRFHMMSKKSSLPIVCSSYIKFKPASSISSQNTSGDHLADSAATDDDEAGADSSDGTSPISASIIDASEPSYEHMFTDDFVSSTAPYDPYFLDSPELRGGKRRKVTNLPGIIASNIPFMKTKEIKRELNDMFRTFHPDLCESNIGLSLSKIRRLKQRFFEISQKNESANNNSNNGSSQLLEITTVALAIVHLERLIIKGHVNRQNRKLVAAVCLLIAFKVNGDAGQSKREALTKRLLDELEDQFNTTRKKILDLEFTVMTWLEFDLIVRQEWVLPHVKRLTSENGLLFAAPTIAPAIQ